MSMHTAVGPLLVSAAYYCGAQIGFALQSPNAPQSVLWLPNSIVLAVLLIVPYRTWPAYLLAAFPAQMLVGWGTEQPPVTMALLFLTNCADSALGAFIVRRVLGDEPFRFDSLRSTLVFACGASIATILMSFADAGVSVATGWIDSPQAAFVTRVRSNILTHMIVVPAIVELNAVNWRRVRPAQLIEPAVLTVLLGGACALALRASKGSPAFPLNLPLPLLLWAAVRFGPGGVGCGAFVIAAIASWNALYAPGPFSSSSSLDEVVSLQVFLLASATPLLFLAAVIRERNRAADALRESESALRQSFGRLRELAGKLIAAQELERASIARDMHDDFNQQLAALAIGISHLRQRAAGGPADLDDVLRTLHERTVALSEQVRNFSHDLHPGMLGHVGLAAALRGHCVHVTQHQGLAINFAASDDLSTVPREAAICVYRIVQEGLRNIVNHAQVKDASVSVTRTGDRLHLTILDCGRGFTPDSAAASGGLGLLSMEERARAAGGSLTITSGDGRGTRLQVHLPIQASA
jgi:two-component system sensor histidine kinase UhpB